MAITKKTKRVKCGENEHQVHGQCLKPKAGKPYEWCKCGMVRDIGATNWYSVRV